MNENVLRLLDMAEALISGYDGQQVRKRDKPEVNYNDPVLYNGFGSSYEAYESEDLFFAAATKEKTFSGLTAKELSDVYERDARRY